MAHGLYEILHQGVRLRFKVIIRKLNKKKLNGFTFSILHPDTSEPIFEFFEQYERIGRERASEWVGSVNTMLSYMEQTKKEDDANTIQDSPQPEV